MRAYSGDLMEEPLAFKHPIPIASKPRQGPFRDWNDGIFNCTADFRSCEFLRFLLSCHVDLGNSFICGIF